jgi:hypothetical protein
MQQESIEAWNASITAASVADEVIGGQAGTVAVVQAGTLDFCAGGQAGVVGHAGVDAGVGHPGVQVGATAGAGHNDGLSWAIAALAKSKEDKTIRTAKMPRNIGTRTSIPP